MRDLLQAYLWRILFRTQWVLVLLFIEPSVAADWPMWHADASRSSFVSHEITTDLHLHWVRRHSKQIPAWPATQAKLQFDIAPHAVVHEQRLFVNSNVDDSVTAYSTRTGEELWTYFANGPVRFAPAAHNGKVYFTSDDGYLYCVSAERGELFWKKRGGSKDRLIIGNQRLVSSWPARGGPVIEDGTVYFAASIWPFMGIFVHAVDAETGKTIWTNSGDGTNMTIQPHGAPSFATVVPQGHLLVSGDHLIVPGGRSVPAVYDTKTGKLLHFQYDGKQGGHAVLASDTEYFLGGHAYSLTKGKRLDAMNAQVYDGDHLIELTKDAIVERSKNVAVEEITSRDRLGRKKTETKFKRKTIRKRKTSAKIDRVHAKSGSVIWCSDGDEIIAFHTAGAKLKKLWSYQLSAKVWEVLVADDRLFVVTEDSKTYCFGSGKRKVIQHQAIRSPKVASESRMATEILNTSHADNGYALLVGFESLDTPLALMAESKLQLIVMDASASRVQVFREQLQAAGISPHRLSVVHGDVNSMGLPPYFANLIVVNKRLWRDPDEPVPNPPLAKARPSQNSPQHWGRESKFFSAETLSRLFHSVRPYGGKLLMRTDSGEQHHIDLLACRFGAKHVETAVADSWQVVTRTGAIPGSDDWTHQYANASQSGISAENNVKAPLGVLWFGGPSHEGILPRHGHGPSPQVSGGRLFIEGPDLIRSVDVYTGRLLWEREIKGVGAYYDNTRHFPGASEIGSNYVSMPDYVYVVYGSKLLKLDAADGQTVGELSLGDEANAAWGFLAVQDNLLIATSAPVAVSKASKQGEIELADDEKAFVVIPKYSTWEYFAQQGAPNNRWKQPGFDSANWQQGEAGFGYGDGDDKTELDMQNKFVSVFIRHLFDGTKLRGAQKIVVGCRYDDGFIAYLNGHEICRSEIKGSGADAVPSSHEAIGFEEFEISNWQKHVVPGKNVLAIEGHNRSSGSSDFSLHPYLRAIRRVRAAAKQPKSNPIRPALEPTRYASGSLRINVFDRYTLEKLWHRDAKQNFRHNSICASGSTLFCIDKLSEVKRRALRRRGLDVSDDATLYALELSTGDVRWSKTENVFGTFLNYSHEHDLLIEGGSLFRDRAYDEVGKGLAAYDASNGDIVWSQPDLSYNGPCLLLRDRLITNGNGGFALDMLTGEKTGWSYKREYGCNTAFGCQNLLTFRSGAAGFYDLANDSGTGNLGGFRSSCTNNLIPANGVLNAPDYTRTCNCAYQNQTSLALVHMPDADLWTFGEATPAEKIGINFGAPGDRRDADGTLWVEYPMVGGKSPGRKITIEPKSPDRFRYHPSLVEGKLNWVAASGLIGVRRIAIDVDSEEECVLRLIFCNSANDSTRLENSFDVFVNGKLLTSIDFETATDSPKRSIVKEFAIVPQEGEVTIEFMSTDPQASMISGVAIVEK